MSYFHSFFIIISYYKRSEEPIQPNYITNSLKFLITPISKETFSYSCIYQFYSHICR